MSNSTAWKSRIQHVVVLTMENRSFDHLLGDFKSVNPECEGINRKKPDSNSVAGISPAFTQTAEDPQDPDSFVLPSAPPFDPMHEFSDVVTQLGGSLEKPRMTGFAQDAYDNYIKKADGAYAPNIWALVQRVMNYIPFGATRDTDPLPAIQGLARAYTVCDHWFSAVPGPTWPNRFFAMMGSAHGRVLMPSDWTDAGLALKNFADQLCRESIFSLLDGAGQEGRVYSGGPVPLAIAAKGWGPRRTMADFRDDVRKGDLAAFTWIEPDHFDGDSQHPPKDLRAGDRFIAEVYNALRANQALWAQTLFVVFYDEHGGFYDHVEPPESVAPDEFESDAKDQNGVRFNFERLGVRVPAILASPWLAAGIEKGVYDHTSLLAFVCDRFGLDRARLGRRVEKTAHFGDASIWLDSPRRDKDMPRSLGLVELGATRALTAYESPLAADTRRVIEGLHAYLNGGDALAAMAPAPPGTRAFGPARSPQALATMADQIAEALARGHGLRPAAAAPRAKPAKEEKRMRLLCLHGIGHGDADTGARFDPGWREHWRKAIEAALQATGVPPGRLQIQWLAYDDLFGDGPNALQIARAAPLLLEGIVEEITRRRAFGLLLPEMLRWTAGMVVQWIEDEALRSRLCERLMQAVSEFRPHAILGHSLGSLIGYDAFRRALVSGGDAAAAIDNRIFVSFGSQIAHPVVVREVWAGRIEPLHDGRRGIAEWFHLHNPQDRVFTRPLLVPDERRSDITTDFDLPFPQEWIDLNHAGEAYLSHPAARAQLWPALVGPASAQRGLRAPVVVPRVARKHRRALLVGINQYPDTASRLNGCVNDVFLMSQMLQRSGYEAAEIRLLLDERATRDEILARLQWLAENVQPGDERVFFYSGHGAQIPRYGASDEPDRMDETLVPVNFDWSDPNTYLTDKEFRNYYSHLPFDQGAGRSANLTVIFDCCHAGGMTRGGARVRGLNPPPDIRHRMLQWDQDADDWTGRDWTRIGTTRPYTGKDTPAPSAAQRVQGAAQELRCADWERFDRQRRLYGHEGPYMPLLIYAAAEAELASEYDHGALSYGAFTYSFVEQLRLARTAEVGFAGLVQTRVAAALKRRRFSQTPQVVGPEKVRERDVPWKPGD
jgi:phospholipase C